jgi:hypothetical protein
MPGPGTTPYPTALGQQQGPTPSTATLVGGEILSIDGATIVLSDASGEVTLELAGDAAPLAATLHVGDLVNASGTLSADGRTVTVDDPAGIVRGGGLTHASATASAIASAGSAEFVIGTPSQHAAQPSQVAPIVAFAVILGLSVLVVVGAFAAKLYGPNRVRNWANRLKTRFVRI